MIDSRGSESDAVELVRCALFVSTERGSAPKSRSLFERSSLCARFSTDGDLELRLRTSRCLSLPLSRLR